VLREVSEQQNLQPVSSISLGKITFQCDYQDLNAVGIVNQASLEMTIEEQPSGYEGECDPQCAGEGLREVSKQPKAQLISGVCSHEDLIAAGNVNQVDSETTIKEQPSGDESECDPQWAGEELRIVSGQTSFRAAPGTCLGKTMTVQVTSQMGWKIGITVELEKSEIKRVRTKRRVDSVEFSLFLSETLKRIILPQEIPFNGIKEFQPGEHIVLLSREPSEPYSSDSDWMERAGPIPSDDACEDPVDGDSRYQVPSSEFIPSFKRRSRTGHH
jgi:hypothetical protein